MQALCSKKSLFTYVKNNFRINFVISDNCPKIIKLEEIWREPHKNKKYECYFKYNFTPLCNSDPTHSAEKLVPFSSFIPTTTI